MPSLSDLFKEFPFEYQSGDLSRGEISGIFSDSRKVVPGALFVAVAGENTDGHLFIQNAIEQGASAVVGEKPKAANLPVPYVQVKNSRQSLAYLAAAFYGYPARKMTMIGVTGTDGKTTTVQMITRILEEAGHTVAMASTINLWLGRSVERIFSTVATGMMNCRGEWEPTCCPAEPVTIFC